MNHLTTKLVAITALIVITEIANSHAAAPAATPPPKTGSQSGAVIAPQTTAPQTAPTVTPPAATKAGNLGSTTLPGKQLLVGPTPDLTAVANAISMKAKSLTIIVSVNAGLKLTSPVTISIGYDGPRQTQTYIASTGNRFVYYDPEGDGKPRQRSVSITLTEPKPGGGFYNFDLPWWADLDPLYGVAIGPLQFQLITSCALVGNSDIDLIFGRPDKSTIEHKFSVSIIPSNETFNDFAWQRNEISASAGFLQPAAVFYSRHCFLPGQCFQPSGVEYSGVNLVPGKSRIFSTVINEQDGECTASIQYTISYTLDQYPNL